jgi:hypothetical protein
VNPSQHPIVILKDVPFEDLQAVVQFMYNGVVNVSADKLTAVLKVKLLDLFFFNPTETCKLNIPKIQPWRHFIF